jgi:N-acyl-D-aspartate/D-glutamate deacylase
LLDLLIKGALVVDGTGRAPKRVSVGFSGEQITHIGDSDVTARREIDAAGLVLAPGFIDPHTHYDAQIFWDPAVDPSARHGVTTVIGGNCGFTFAPIRPEDADYTRKMMAVVEGMSVEALEQGLPWSWRTFGEYLALLEGSTAVNAGFMVGHCAIRQFVMGPAAVEGAATDEQIQAMVNLLHESLDAGGLGLSTTLSPTHTDAEGRAVPSRAASRAELLALCEAVGQHDGTTLEGAFAGSQGHFEDEELDLLVAMTCAAGRPLNWNLLTIGTDPDAVYHQLTPVGPARQGGGDVVALTMPVPAPLNVNFRTHCSLNNLPGWNEVLTLPTDERIEQLRRPEVRARLERGANSPSVPERRRHLARFEEYVVGDPWASDNAQYRGRTVGSIAKDQGIAPLDALLKLVCDDDLRTILWPPEPNDSAEVWRRRASLWTDPSVLLGGSDAGAHVDRMCGAPYPARFIGEMVRGRALLSLERAVQLLTDAPARLFGLKDRGRIELGGRADVVLFDPDSIGATEPAVVFDLPGGSYRLTAEPTGIEEVFVNGTSTVLAGKPTGATPGSVLRSRKDTSSEVIAGRLSA